MLSDNTKQFLANYHDASRKLMARYEVEFPGDESQADFTQLASAGRELLSRCILSDDPRSMIFLIAELAIVMRLLGQKFTAHQFEIAAHELTDHYVEHGTLGNFPLDRS